jgi:PAS domain S-box-containing protein
MNQQALNLLMQLPLAIAVFEGPEYQIISANDKALELWGKTPEEAIQKPLFQVLPELIDQGFKNIFRQVEQGEAITANEHPVELLRPNGIRETRYLNFSINALRGEDGNIEGIVGTAVDVTELVLSRKEAKDAYDTLNFRTAVLEAQNQATSDGVLIVDSTGKILLYNQPFAEIWRMPQEILDSKNDDAALKHAMTMLKDPESFLERVNNLYSRGREISYDQILFKDGRIIERNGTPILSEHGIYYGWAWYFRDITDRIKQEQKFQNLVRQARDPILILKGENLVLEVANEALFELWDVGQEAMNKPLLEILPEMKDQGFRDLLLNVMNTGEPFYGYEVPVIFNRKSGVKETRYFNFSDQPYREANGEITGVLILATDVTSQVLLKLKLRENEKNFRNMILQAPVAMCILKGPSFTVEIANDLMFELWGKRPDEVMHKPVFEGIPEARNQGLEELLSRVYSTGETFSANERPVVLERDGVPKTLYVNFVYEPFREGDGTVSGIMAVAIDVTDLVLARKKTEQSEEELQRRVKERTTALEQQKSLINSILDASITGVLALEAIRNEQGDVVDFTIIKINRQFTSLVGLDERILGKRYLEYFPNSITLGIFGMYVEVLNSKQPVRKELYSTNLNLNSWFDISVAPLGENGVVATFANISAQREAAIRMEEQKNLLDSILKNSPVGITVYKAVRDSENKIDDFQCILSNNAAEKFTGIPQDIRLRKTVLEITPELKGSPLFSMAATTLEEGKPFISEYYHQRVQKWLELSVVKLSEDRLINVFKDITPIKEAQMQLEKHVEELKRTNADLEHFTYAASHDLKEPVRKVHLFKNRLKESFGAGLTAEQNRFFERMEVAARRMQYLIDDLLSYYQVSTISTPFEEVNINHLIGEVLLDFDLEIEEKKASVSVGKLCTIKGHPRHLQQAFHNLIGNALKYSKPDTPPELRIDCKQVLGKDANIPLLAAESRQAYHMITLADNGIGFDPVEAKRIFNVFQRLHSSAAYEGTGLGLAIVRKVVDNHQGFITAEGKPGRGATFKILFPVKEGGD